MSSYYTTIKYTLTNYTEPNYKVSSVQLNILPMIQRLTKLLLNNLDCTKGSMKGCPLLRNRYLSSRRGGKSKLLLSKIQNFRNDYFHRTCFITIIFCSDVLAGIE